MKATVSANRTAASASTSSTTRSSRTARSSRRTTAATRAYARRAQRAGQPVEEAPTRDRAVAVAKRAPFVASMIALLSGGLVVTLYLTTRAAESTYELTAAQDTNQRLQAELAQLQRDVEAAESAPELAARARTIGMVPAGDPAHLVVNADGSVKVVGEPKPASGAPMPNMNTQRAIIATDSRASSDESIIEAPSASTQGTSGTPQTVNAASGQPSGEQLTTVTAGTESER